MRILAAVLAALASTSAAAKPAAGLYVTALDTRPGIAAETDVDLKLPGPGASVDVFVPPGYTIELGARPGTVIGTARTSVVSPLVAAAPGLWKATGLTVAVARSSDGGYRLEYSLAQPVREVDLDLQQGVTNPPGSVVTWRAFVGNGVEVRSVVAFPQLLTVRATVTRGGLRAGGRLLFVGKPRPGVNVHIAVATRDDFADARELGVARTRAGGRYDFRASLAAKAEQLLLVAYVNFYDAACPDRGCARESISPPPAEIAATIPKR